MEKKNKIVRVKRYIWVAAACIILVATVGGGLTHQNEVKAAWYKMTSLIGRILGIEKETDEYVKNNSKDNRKKWNCGFVRGSCSGCKKSLDCIFSD